MTSENATALRRRARDIARDLTTLSNTPDDAAYAVELRDDARRLSARADELDPPAGTRED